jgi:hypothetical protein
MPIRYRAQPHDAQQLQARAGPLIPGHQQPLAVVGKLHFRARNLDAGPGAGGFWFSACFKTASASVTSDCAVSTSASARTAAR